jgi:hypothetical protein
MSGYLVEYFSSAGTLIRHEHRRGLVVMGASNMSPIDRALWNVAEAASRYSDKLAESQRRKAWTDIEQAMAAARALFAQASTAPPAPSLPAEQMAAAQRAAEVLRQRAEEAERGRAEMEAACWQMEADRDAARATAEAARATISLLTAEIESLKQALAVADAERAEAVVALERSMMRVPERPAPTPAAPVVPAAVAEEPVVSGWSRPDDGIDDVRIEHMGLLSVKATSYNLLPESLAEHLVPGARVLRQDGRMAAMVGVPCGPDGSMGPAATEQAGRLVAQGFRVDWVTEDELVA